MTGHIRKRGERSWAILVDLPRGPDGKRRRKWHTVHGTKKDAQRKRNELLHQLETGAYVEPARMTLKEFLARWLGSIESKVGAKTLERYEQLADHHIIPCLGTIALPRLQPLALQEFYEDRLRNGRRKGAGGLSPQTVLHIHRILRASLAQAVRWQLLARNPADGVDPPKVEPKEMSTLDEPATAWLFTAAEGTRFYVPIVLAATLGIRRGEIFGLTWTDLHLGAAMATICRSLQQTRAGLKEKMPKNGKGRPVTLPRFTVDVLRDHSKAQDELKMLFGKDYQNQDLVCPLPDGRPWPPDDFSSAFGRFRKKCGLKIRFHDLRHSHATQLLGQGVNPKVVSERLGHSSVQITLDRYSHVMPNIQEEAAQKIDTVLRREIEKQRNRVS